ncbi:hypothetical protein IE53DRAFT_389279 [Violaceomyces palustris]|uniref:Uncharacterized protein n=1 Tax=Violaceomyces palustris TaxID=1673888 RepID=A0ACD0NRT5_9BASI|nr:hypothetical protein IE53DRAFT_389279 [Violaceomyces palustris]
MPLPSDPQSGPKAFKRKAQSADPTSSGSEDDSDGEDPDFINVDFDFKAPVEIDFLAIKRLLQQLFYTHASKLDLGGLADLIIKGAEIQGLGTVIKVDGDEDQDPYAFVSATQLQGQPSSSSSSSPPPSTPSSSLTSYFVEVLSKSESTKPFLELVQNAATAKEGSAPIVAILHERMVNLPPQLALHLYRMIGEELEAVRNAKSPVPPAPSHLLFFSRVFSSAAYSDDEAMDEDDEDAPTGLAGARRRKNKMAKRQGKKQGVKPGPKKGTQDDDEMGLFHPEDKALSELASFTHTFRFPPPPDAADSFEAPLFGRLVAIPYGKLGEMMSRFETDLGPVQGSSGSMMVA